MANRSKKIGAWIITGTLAASLLLSACAEEMPWAQPEATPEAISLPSYQPSTGTASATSETATAETATSAPAPTAEQDALPVEAASAGAQSGQAVAMANSVGLPAWSSASIYNGEIVAEQQIRINAEVAGQILDVNVDIGDRVNRGQQMVRIDSAALEAQREQALAGLIAAQSQLDLLLEESDAADLEAARAGVNAAYAAYQRALEGPTQEDLTSALAQVRQAEAAVSQAQAAYNQVRGNPNIGMLPQSLQLQQATIGLEAAQAQYDKVAKGATADAIAGAYAQLAQARAQLERLQQGPQAAQIRAAEAQVKQAESGLYLSQLQLDKATVEAPIDGIVAEVSVGAGAMAAPGVPLITLVSEDVKITISVEESRLSQISVGQPVVIQADAFPGQTIEGIVSNIAPTVNAATRTVQVTIRPVEDDAMLMPGMSATVTLAGGEG